MVGVGTTVTAVTAAAAVVVVVSVVVNEAGTVDIAEEDVAAFASEVSDREDVCGVGCGLPILTFLSLILDMSSPVRSPVPVSVGLA